jgi:hypothetical protein
MSNPEQSDDGMLLNEKALEVMRRRARVILLLDAAERAGIAPLNVARLHALTYLADVLSPVWNLPAFDGKVLKTEGGPHYPDIQREVDRLTALGLVEVSNLRYVDIPGGGARVDGDYTLRLASEQLSPILSALGAGAHSNPFDPRDREVHSFLVDLAGALGRLPQEEIEVAATVDATYSDLRIGTPNVVDFASWVADPLKANLSVRATQRFRDFLPENSALSPGEKIYLYASYLGRKINGR